MPITSSGEKTWRLGRDNWIAGAGSWRGLPRPPNPWPDPTPEGAVEPRTPKEWAQAVDAQMRSGRYTTGPRYSAAVIGTPAGRFPELFRVSNDEEVQTAGLGTVFTGSYAKAAEVQGLIPTRLADNRDDNRDLVIAMASRTLRAYGDELNALGGGPSISWPVYFYQWDLVGVAVSGGQLIPESQGAAAEWRHWTNRTHAVRFGSTSQIKAKITEIALDSQSKGLWPESAPRLENVQLNWSLPSLPADPPPTTAAGVVSAAPISEKES
jgi:hypothetical protein